MHLINMNYLSVFYKIAKYYFYISTNQNLQQYPFSWSEDTPLRRNTHVILLRSEVTPLSQKYPCHDFDFKDLSFWTKNPRAHF